MDAMIQSALGPWRKLAASRLVRRQVELSGLGEIVGWWEIRRVVFNLAVGFMGAITCVLLLATAFLAERILGEPIGLPDPPLVGVFLIVLYGVLANVCYTGGWVAEILVRAVWRAEAGRFGEIAFSLGLVFAMALTLMPPLVIIPLVLARIFF